MFQNIFTFFIFIAGTICHAQQSESQYIQNNDNDFELNAQDTLQRLQFELYPNPLVGDLLSFISPRSEIKEIAILNILGEEIYKISTFNNQIQLPNLTRGIYIVKLKQANEIGLRRLVIP